MTTLVKLRGLDREPGESGGQTQRFIKQGIRVQSPLGPAFVGGDGVKAVFSQSAGSNKDFTFTAAQGGTWGNNVQVALVTAGGTVPASIVITFPGAGLANPLVTYNFATVTGTITPGTVAGQLALFQASPGWEAASDYVVASVKAGQDGTGLPVALGTTSLATGSNGTTAVSQPIVFVLNGAKTVVVDIDNTYNQRSLRRNAGRFISLGQQ